MKTMISTGRRLFFCACFFFLCGPFLAAQNWIYLAGTPQGLYGINRYGAPGAVWTGGQVKKILFTGTYWALLGDQGITVSRDLVNWEPRNRGLPVKTIKVFEGGTKSFIPAIQEIKDLEVHPQNPDILVCAVKDAVYLSRDAGQNWQSLGMPPYRTNGIKAVAAASMPATMLAAPAPSAPATAPPSSARDSQEALIVFVSHSTYGVHYIDADKPRSGWKELNQGLETMETTDNPDEVSDIAAFVPPALPGPPEIFVSQTFKGRIYRLDWEAKAFTPLWSDGADFGAADSLSVSSQSIRFVRDGEVAEFDRAGQEITSRRDLLNIYFRAGSAIGSELNCLYALPPNGGFGLSELWLLREDGTRPERQQQALGREGLYIPANHAMDDSSLAPYLRIMAEKNLNMAVIDMKDDYGRLRFSPRNQALLSRGRVFWPVDLDHFVTTMKERNIYLVARIVVFKDPELARREGGRYAVWDTAANKPWMGYYDTRRKKLPPGESYDDQGPQLREILPSDDSDYEILRTYYDERWVDPYSEEVWEYTAALAEELISRGFNEIQFDYIRFPTDGVNLSSAEYRWKDPGMDMESAVLSFLRHVRSRISAPISIDIYGANGWYRTGARTGQEVELLAPYVDVICPMYYPSHFEQDFLAQDPAELRPYRIYYQGTRRAGYIGRGRVIVRPYVQAFYLTVAYDRKYYDETYVLREVQGVRDAGKPGLTYWNNTGRYTDIPAAD
ncbi:MAG: hypothetical protein LBI85_06665 [Spirochaetaceae bacterium]|jgi:hypothetical protein|nr:hypothetical protein [Spirochaetaceae bacterium]